jgi:diguanylate cyclase (GGDEF)-like protein
MMGYEEFSTILIVDDNNVNLKILSNILENEGYQVAAATSGKEALEYVELDKPDLILLDVMMPGMDGYEVCSILKNNPDTTGIPVIFNTAKTDSGDLIKGFEAGGVDYISKPFNTMELKMRVSTHMNLKKSIDKLNKYNLELKVANDTIKLQNNQLMEVLAKLEYASQTDPLTELYNRRYITQRILDEEVRNARSSKEFSVVICDIDFFKKVNDKYGHDCGDYVLKALSQLLRSSLRKQDYVARWGGEEFLLLLPETNAEGGKIVAEGLKQKVEDMQLLYNEFKINITMTFGVSEYNKESGIDAMIIRADNALYEGKRNGRNCVKIL